MSDAISDSLGEGIVYQAQLPLAWEVLDAAAPAHDEHNEKVLGTLESLEALPAASGEGGTATDIARLEFKLDLLMDLVTQLLSREAPLPAPRAVSLGAHALEFRLGEGEAAPATGEHLQIAVYLHAEYPRPLILTGQAATVTGAPGAQDVAVAFDSLGEAAQDRLEKLIFRHHRRQVAQRRAPGSPS
jgi:hypothetical protein